MKQSIIILISFFLQTNLICVKSIDRLTQQNNFTLSDPIEKTIGNDKMPEIVGGINSIQSKILYPKKAKEKKIEGKVYIKCKITSEGKVEEIKLVKGIGFGCDEEAIKVVKDSKWKPGEIDNQKVDMYVSIPIIFEIKKT